MTGADNVPPKKQYILFFISVVYNTVAIFAIYKYISSWSLMMTENRLHKSSSAMDAYR